VTKHDYFEQDKLLNKAIDRIMLTHRNTKLFLFFMSGPCLLLLMTIKYSIKFILIYFLYKKKKNKGEIEEDKEVAVKEAGL